MNVTMVCLMLLVLRWNFLHYFHRSFRKEKRDRTGPLL